VREQPDPALATLIRRRREERNTTQEQLAFDAGITSSSLSRIERGRSNPSWTTVRRLAAALGLSLSELVTDVERESPLSSGVHD